MAELLLSYNADIKYFLLIIFEIIYNKNIIEINILKKKINIIIKYFNNFVIIKKYFCKIDTSI